LVLATLGASTRREFPIKTLLNIAAAGFALFACGAASTTVSADEIAFTGAVGPNAQVTGTVFVDDSSGEMNSVIGTVSGAVSGKYTLDRSAPHAEFPGPSSKLTVSFERADQRVTAHLDNCASADSCIAGAVVNLWEKK
jgi:hypothetical protein